MKKEIKVEISEKEYWQCGHVRKCKWIGTYEELEDIKSTGFADVSATDQVCPKCGNKEFYVLNEEEYKKIMSKRKQK